MVSLHLSAKVIIAAGLGILCLILPRSSRADGVSFICPNQDLAGRPLQDQSFGTTVFCAYGRSLNCTYNGATGDLLTDNDGGDCPSNAVVSIGAPATPAPALAPWGVMVTAILLVSFGAVALRHRMRTH
jgi:hypothetical protein